MTKLEIATTDSFGAQVIRGLEPLHGSYPDLEINVLTSNATIDLKAGEADLAVRMFRNTDEGLASLKLGSLGWSLYASEKYLAGRQSGMGLLEGQRVIGYVDSLQRAMAGAAWIAANASPDSIRMQCSGPGAALKVALTGFGVCVIPCYMAAGTALRRVTEEVVATTDVYAVFSPDRRQEPLLAAAIDALFEMFDRDHGELSGAPSRG
jgi:DNA-binding transcriptional LysR family regulator